MENQKKKLKLILAGSGKFALQIVEKIQKDERIDFIGVICDQAAGIEGNTIFLNNIKNLGLKEIFLEEKYLEQSDIILACEYRRAIPKWCVGKYRFLNCHVGLLPKYRGFSANAWAIINGETEIGYTIHQMDEKFDNGDIYYSKKFVISKEQIYADLYDIILKDITNNICDILIQVYKNELQPVKQTGKGLYFTRFYKEMGDLKDFSENSEYIRNLHRSMARPLGTGIYFWFKGTKYYPGNVITGSDIGIEDYIGIPGKLVNREEKTIWVKTKDNLVILSDIQTEDGKKVDDNFFRIGNKLGK
ncbi:formyltransferase family protein [Candidatus Ventrimonas sp. KK005]